MRGEFTEWQDYAKRGQLLKEDGTTHSRYRLLSRCLQHEKRRRVSSIGRRVL